MKRNTLKKCAALVTTVALSFSILAGCNASPKQAAEAKSTQPRRSSSRSFSGLLAGAIPALCAAASIPLGAMRRNNLQFSSAVAARRQAPLIRRRRNPDVPFELGSQVTLVHESRHRRDE